MEHLDLTIVDLNVILKSSPHNLNLFPFMFQPYVQVKTTTLAMTIVWICCLSIFKQIIIIIKRLPFVPVRILSTSTVSPS